MKIGIIVAMQSEFDLVSQIMEEMKTETINHLNFAEGKVYGKDIVLMKCGIGKVCSALGAVEMIKNFNPDYVINTGIAGGIDETSQVMDMVAGEKIVYHDVWCGEGNEYGQVQGLPTYYESDAKLLDLITSIDADINIYKGLICSGDKFITDKKELKEIKDKFTCGMAVDMESCSIAQVCHMYKKPYLSLRIISDTPGVENHWQQYENFWGQAPEKSLSVIKALLKKM